jgi:hypothetical protein
MVDIEQYSPARFPEFGSREHKIWIARRLLRNLSFARRVRQVERDVWSLRERKS